MASPERLLLPDVELSRPALVLAQRFVQRWDLYAHQLDDGSYICVHEPLNVGHLSAHLRGEITLGAYLLSQESQVPFLVLDADDDGRWERLGHLARVLDSEEVSTYLEKSRGLVTYFIWRRRSMGERCAPLAKDCWPLTKWRGWNCTRNRIDSQMDQAL